MSVDTNMVEITARFAKRLYRSDDSSFCVGLYESIEKEYDYITMVGSNLPELHFPVTYAGEWKNDPKYGRQFAVEFVVTQLPSSTEDMEEFVTSMKVGIGKKRVKKMVALVGPDKFWDTLNNDPRVFLQVSGINEATIKKLQYNVNALSYQRALLQYFKGDLKLTGTRYKRLTSLYANRLDEMLPEIQANPFILQQIGIPFGELDFFCSRNTDFLVNDNRRLTAATIQVLLDAQKQSHVCLPEELMPMKLRALLSHYGAVSLEECRMFLYELLNSKFVTHANGHFFLTRAYKEEQFVAREIIKKLQAPNRGLSKEKIYKALEDYGKQRKNEKGQPAPITLAEGQKEAVYTALTHRFCIVTGGPGTGKSTILDAILYCWKKFYKDNDWCLMSPTGKAAVRMIQATGDIAGTVHSTLGLGVCELPIDPEAGGLHPMKVEKGLVVVDESSMLDLSTTAALFEAVRQPKQHLVLVGDPDQLPSVGYGNVLADLINSGVVPVAKLTAIYRQAAGNPIIVNAAKMRDGDVELDWSHAFFKGYNQGSDEANMVSACRYFMKCVNKLGIKNVAMLSPYHKKGAISTDSLNAMLQEAFNPDRGRGSVKTMGQTIRFADRVMQLKNTATAVNGDVGTVQMVNPDADVDEPCVVVKFDNTDIIKEYTKDELNQLELAYALSVHKSQGSQYECVVMVLPTEYSPFIRRDLVYTGATRASKYMAFFGPMSTLQQAIRNANLDKRYTTLVRLLQCNYKPCDEAA